MASFTYSCTALSVSITVRGISSGDMVRFYVRRNPGSAVVVDEQYRSSGSSLTKTFAGLSASTGYAVNAGVVSGGSTAWIGAQTFTTPSQSGGGDTKPRPNNWYWQSVVSSGATISLSASEWNAFCDRINAFREYAGLSAYYFTSVYRGLPISAAIVNQAWDAIAAVNSARGVPARVYSGDTISAAFFQNLQSALNSIS